MINRYQYFYLLTFSFISLPLWGLIVTPLDFLQPDDPNFARPLNRQQRFQIDMLSQFSIHNLKGRNGAENAQTVNVLQIWNADQSALNMIRGFDPDSTVGQLALELNSANDDSIRGHMLPTAELESNALSFKTSWQLKTHFSLVLGLPFYYLKLSDITWTDQTANINTADLLTKSLLTANFVQNVKNLGGGLDISQGWRKIGFGDLTAAIYWHKNFPQPAKPILKEVSLQLHSGFSLPTGERKNEDELFSLPLGNDGATGVLFGGGITLNWFKTFYGKINVDFLKLFGSTRERRIKVDPNQTDLVLLTKVKARKDWGFTQRYNLSLGAHVYRNFNFAVVYQHAKHHNDTISPYNNTYSAEVANTAESLQDWTTHNVILNLNYTYKQIAANLFFKQPFNGRRSFQNRIVGLEFGFSF